MTLWEDDYSGFDYQGARLQLREELLVAFRNTVINRSVDKKARPSGVRGSTRSPIPYRFPRSIIYLIREKKSRSPGDQDTNTERGEKDGAEEDDDGEAG
jgi:hypothetical protein